MESYKCAYRDPKSPLTPIKPMDTKAFEFGSLALVKSSLTPRTSRTALSTKSSSSYLSPNPTRSLSASSRTLKSLGTSPVSKSLSLVKPTASTTASRYLQPSSTGSFSKITTNVSSVTTKTSTKVVQRQVMQQVSYENGRQVSSVTRFEQHEETSSLAGRGALLASSSTRPSITYKRASPVSLKPLCPRVAAVLEDIGLEKYCELFEEEEVDYKVFRMLDERDLWRLGIRNQCERDLLLRAIRRSTCTTYCY